MLGCIFLSPVMLPSFLFFYFLVAISSGPRLPDAWRGKCQECILFPPFPVLGLHFLPARAMESSRPRVCVVFFRSFVLFCSVLFPYIDLCNIESIQQGDWELKQLGGHENELWGSHQRENGCSVERWGVGISGEEKRLLRDKSQMPVWWW